MITLAIHILLFVYSLVVADAAAKLDRCPVPAIHETRDIICQADNSQSEHQCTEEWLTANRVVDLDVASSRAFKSNSKITCTRSSDPAIAEAILYDNKLVLLGRTPGSVQLKVRDDVGDWLAIDLRVTRNYEGLTGKLREIDPQVSFKVDSLAGKESLSLIGEVERPESIFKAFAAALVFMDDHGMRLQLADGTVLNLRAPCNGCKSEGSGVFDPCFRKPQIIVSDGRLVRSLLTVRGKNSEKHPASP